MNRPATTKWRGGLALLAVAAALMVLDVPLARAAGGTDLVAKKIESEVPLEPGAPAWAQAPPLAVPVTAVSLPPGGATEVSVRALQNGKDIAFRMEWADPRPDTVILRPQDFADQAAITMAESSGGAVCMGQADNISHIWQWKVEWQQGQRDLKSAFPGMYVDGYPMGDDLLFARPAAYVGNLRAQPDKASPVEHLVAGGLGSLTTHEVQNATGNGEWKDGRWAVVFRRPLKAGGNGDLGFTGGKLKQVAFAVWDGAQMSRNGMKSASTWTNLDVEGQTGLFGVTELLLLLIAAGAAVAAYRWRRRRWAQVEAKN